MFCCLSFTNHSWCFFTLFTLSTLFPMKTILFLIFSHFLCRSYLFLCVLVYQAQAMQIGRWKKNKKIKNIAKATDTQGKRNEIELYLYSSCWDFLIRRKFMYPYLLYWKSLRYKNRLLSSLREGNYSAIILP